MARERTSLARPPDPKTTGAAPDEILPALRERPRDLLPALEPERRLDD